MSPVQNGRVILAERPTGYIIPGQTLVYDTSQTVDIDAVSLNGGVLVKTFVFSVDPSMRNRMNGAWSLHQPITNFGIAKVLRSDVPKFKPGDLVEGIIGIEEYAIVKDAQIQGLRVIHNDVGLPLSTFVGVAGMPGKTAYFGWKEYSQAKKGETVFVTTGAGAVGSVVVQLAKLDGLRVIASAGSDEKVAYMKELGADIAFNYKTTSTAEILQKEGPIDIYWDNVGGETLDLALANSKHFARFIECGMISGYNGTFEPIKNLGQIIYKEVKIYGLYVLGPLTAKYAAEFEEVFPKLIKEGKIKYQEDITRGLDKLGDAILAQHKGENKGKSVVIVADE